MMGVTYHAGAFLPRSVWKNHRLITGKHCGIRRAKSSTEFLIVIGSIDENKVDFDRSLSVLQANVLKEFLHVTSAIQRSTENIDRILKIDSNTPEK
jgi:hypothetical protein